MFILILPPPNPFLLQSSKQVKIEILSKSLPYIHRFGGTIITVKYGNTIRKELKLKVLVVEKPATESPTPVLEQEVDEKADESKEGRSLLQ
ncbi:unnamed protein product [Linum trigynum]|uniref:Uncharacterized protein n=1 Tax=Linum trigynum TaxID=586398 RepID=A0AAV2G572_9ROSI